MQISYCPYLHDLNNELGELQLLTCTVILIPKFNNCTLFFLSGTLTVEEVYKDRDQFASLVREVAAPDVGRMGIEILSFTIKDVYDNVTYLASLGKNHRHLRIRMNHKTYNRHLKISNRSFTLKKT